MGAPLSGGRGNCPIPGHPGVDLLSPPDRYQFEIVRKAIADNREHSFFIWYHAGDLHARASSASFLRLPPGYWKDLWRRVRSGREYLGWPQRYDACLRSIDEEIRLVLNTLRDAALLERTLVVVTSDHGTHWDLDGDAGDFEFDDANSRVPLVFYNPGLGKMVVEGLVGAVDIAPTIVELVGIGRVGEFGGRSIVDATRGREHVLVESTGRGAADLKRKPIAICLRSRRYRYVSMGDDEVARIEGREAGERGVDDREELLDLSRGEKMAEGVLSSPTHGGALSDFRRLAAERRATIRGDSRVYSHPHADAPHD